MARNSKYVWNDSTQQQHLTSNFTSVENRETKETTGGAFEFACGSQ